MPSVGVWVLWNAATVGVAGLDTVDAAGLSQPVSRPGVVETKPASAESTDLRTAPVTSSPKRSANLLLADGSFELGQPGWCRLAGTDDLMPALSQDQAHAADGQFSARWLVEPEYPNCYLSIPLPMAEDVAGGDYTVGLSLRASSSQTMRASIAGRAQAGPSDWTVTPQWRRFELRFSIPGGSGSVPLELRLAVRRALQPRVVWVDAVKVEAGGIATPYQPPGAPIIGVSVGRRAGLLFEGQPARITAGAYCPMVSSERVDLRWRLDGGSGRPNEGHAPLLDVVTRAIRLHDAPLRRGWYRLELTLGDRNGKALAKRALSFGVARRLSNDEGKRFRLIVPARGPRSDALAREMGLTVARPNATLTRRPSVSGPSGASQPAAVSFGSFPTSQPATPPVTTRIDELTRYRAAGVRVVRWPTAWDELIDEQDRWRSLAVAVNVWLDLLTDSGHLRRISLDQGAIRIDVFGGPDRSVAFVTPHPELGKRSRFEVPLPAVRLVALDLHGVRLLTTDRDGWLVVDLGSEPIYLLAGPNLTRGQFAMRLQDSRVVQYSSERDDSR